MKEDLYVDCSNFPYQLPLLVNVVFGWPQILSILVEMALMDNPRQILLAKKFDKQRYSKNSILWREIVSLEINQHNSVTFGSIPSY